jgi:hypothetical protein
MGFYDQLVQKLQSSPGVQAAAITTKLPLQGGTNGYVKIPGQETESMTGPLVEWSSISSDYFHVMSIPLLEGRELARKDCELTGKLVRELAPVENPKAMRNIASKYLIPAVVNQTMATTFWPRQSAIGKIFENFVQFQGRRGGRCKAAALAGPGDAGRLLCAFLGYGRSIAAFRGGGASRWFAGEFDEHGTRCGALTGLESSVVQRTHDAADCDGVDARHEL